MEEEYEEETQEITGKITGKKLVEKKKIIKKEKNRISKLFKDMDENSKKIATKLIENASFMSVQLDELQSYITSHGVKESYMNGQNQFGYKESVESKVYNSMVKNYMNVIKQLKEMLPEGKTADDDIDNEFKRFNNI